MKQPPKIKLILYFCLGLFVLNACTLEEDVAREQAHQEKMKLESKSFHELLQTSLFSTAYKKVINKKVTLSNDFAARTALEDQYGFTIVEDQPVKVITDVDGITYYTIAIERDVKEELKFENLVIKVDSTDVDAALFKYELNEKATYIPELDTYNVNVKGTDVEPLQIDGKASFIVINCWNIVTMMCDNTAGGTWPHNHIATEGCISAGINLYYSVTEFCFGFDSGGGDGEPGTPPVTTNTEGGGSSGNGTSTNGTNNGVNQNGDMPLTNPTPIIKTVIIPSEEVVDESSTPIDHIQQLNTMTNRSGVKTRILELKSQVTTVAMEQGTEYFVDEEDPSSGYFSEDPPTGITGVRFGPVEATSIIRLHSHDYPGVEPVFSGEDVKNTGAFFKGKVNLGAEDANNIISILVSTGIYALRVTDEEKAYQFGVKATNDAFVKLFRERYKEKVRNKSKRDCSCLSGAAYEQALLDNLILFLVSENTGLTLYSATVDASGNLSWSILP